MHAASSWYAPAIADGSSPVYASAIFWAIAGVIAALLVGGLTIVVTWVVGVPKQRLFCKMRSVEAESLSQYHGKLVTSPRIATLTIKARGRRDISPDAFHGSPLPFDVAVPIVECLEVGVDPTDQPVPPVTTSGSVLELHPVKLGKCETIKVRLLVDGVPKLRKPVQSLTDVQIVSSEDEEGKGKDTAERDEMLLVGAIVLIIYLAFMAFVAIANPPMPAGLPYT
jgi:hypothetical protein